MDEKIPHYINNPTINRLTAPENRLYRPKIHFGKAFLVIFGVVALTSVMAWILERQLLWSGNIDSTMKEPWCFFSIYWKLQLLVFLGTLRYTLIWFVRIYQRYAKSETRLRCKFTPSCSDYAILALKKYGAILGCIKTIRRLLRCGPEGGIDYP